MNTEAYEDCLELGHEWENPVMNLYPTGEWFETQNCKWCGEERDDG